MVESRITPIEIATHAEQFTFSPDGLRQGNPDDWHKMDIEFRDRLIRSALRRGVPPATAEDIVQEAELKLFINRDRIPDDVRSALFRNVSHLSVDWSRKTYGVKGDRPPTISYDSPEAFVSEDDVVATTTDNVGTVIDLSSSTEQIIILNETVETLNECLQEIPFEQRTALEMNFCDELTHSECAKEMNAPLGTTKTRIRLGIKKLHSMMRERETQNGFSLDNASANLIP